jgi:hypothetical protein
MMFMLCALQKKKEKGGGSSGKKRSAKASKAMPEGKAGKPKRAKKDKDAPKGIDFTVAALSLFTDIPCACYFAQAPWLPICSL